MPNLSPFFYSCACRACTGRPAARVPAPGRLPGGRRPGPGPAPCRPGRRRAGRAESRARLNQITAENKKEMQDLRVSVLGKKGSLTEILKGMKDVSAVRAHESL